jgi:2',3'-cyclic-nucleotide 2'-phosphodiesterase (5'-nucleotidase family)
MFRKYIQIAFVMLGILGMSDVADAKPSLRVFHTSNVKGYVDECGCKYNPSGGIARRATFFEQHDDVPSIKLDGGDIVGEDSPIGRMQTTYLLRAMHRMGYRTLGIGPRDLMYGMEFLRNASEEHDLTLTNANIVGSDGNTLFTPYVIENISSRGVLGFGKSEIRVGIVNVIGQDRPPLTSEDDPSVSVIDPISAARILVNDLQNKTDMVVVMAYVNTDDLRELKTIEGVDVILLTRTTRVSDNGWVIDDNGVAIAYSTIQGRGVGQVDIEIRDKAVVDVGGSMTMLTSDVEDDADMARLRQEFEQWKADYLSTEPSD